MSTTENLSATLEKLAEAEANAERLLSELKDKLVEDISEQPFAGTMTGENPCMFTMPAAAILNEPWSPEYHLPKAQAEAVDEKLKTCSTLRQTADAISSMLKHGFIGSEYKRTWLNPRTMKILKESGICKYAGTCDKKPKTEEGG